MNSKRITDSFARAKSEGRGAFVAYFTMGYPTLEKSEAANAFLPLHDPVFFWRFTSLPAFLFVGRSWSHPGASNNVRSHSATVVLDDNTRLRRDGAVFAKQINHSIMVPIVN